MLLIAAGVVVTTVATTGVTATVIIVRPSPPLLLLTFEYNTERDDNGIADAVDVTALCTADGEANCEVVTTPPVVNAAAFTLAFTTRLPTERE